MILFNEEVDVVVNEVQRRPKIFFVSTVRALHNLLFKVVSIVNVEL